MLQQLQKAHSAITEKSNQLQQRIQNSPAVQEAKEKIVDASIVLVATAEQKFQELQDSQLIQRVQAYPTVAHAQSKYQATVDKVINKLVTTLAISPTKAARSTHAENFVEAFGRGLNILAVLTAFLVAFSAIYFASLGVTNAALFLQAVSEMAFNLTASMAWIIVPSTVIYVAKPFVQYRQTSKDLQIVDAQVALSSLLHDIGNDKVLTELIEATSIPAVRFAIPVVQDDASEHSEAVSSEGNDVRTRSPSVSKALVAG